MINPKPDIIMYVYISSILCSPEDLIDPGVRTQTSDMYLGVTRVNSPMDKTLHFILKNNKIIDSGIKISRYSYRSSDINTDHPIQN